MWSSSTSMVWPCGVHCNTCLAMLSSLFLNVCVEASFFFFSVIMVCNLPLVFVGYGVHPVDVDNPLQTFVDKNL